jgi:hypothetical protein
LTPGFRLSTLTGRRGARRLAGGAALAAVLAAASAWGVRPPDTVRLDAGGLIGDFLGGGWSASDRTDLNTDVGALDPSAAGFSRFRFRAAGPAAEIDLPVAAREGSLRVTLRAMARVRTAVSFHVGGDPVAEIVIPRGPWGRHAVELPGGGSALQASLALRPLPMVRVPDEFMQQPVVWVAEIEAASPSGLRFSPAVRALMAAVPLAVFAFGLAIGTGPLGSLLAAAAVVGALAALAQLAPLALVIALTRLLPLALAAGILTRVALSSWTTAPPGARAGLSALVAAGILFHGALPFVPGFDPYDVEVHVRRSQDLGRVPLEYDALLRYGSHLPTETQTFGTATAALGEKTLIPYSPLPYVAFYALDRLGVDLHWGMIVLDTVLAMAVVPWLWSVAARVWTPASAWIAALLYTLDLPVWHHLGRAHVPASFGNALAAAVLLYLAGRADRIDTPRRIAVAASALAVAVLGYSSLVVFFGLFGAVLLALLAADARALSPASKKGLAAALVVGGLIAGGVFYFHYLPGLLRGGGELQQEPDLFQPRTYLIFHNESRQSMRVWAAGFAIPVGAGLLAAPFALRRALPSARAILLSWLASWVLVMVAKEPFGFPRPLRWGKEDQFVSPLLALLIGGGIGCLPRRWMRWGAAAAAVGTALWLEAGDFGTHLSALMP